MKKMTMIFCAVLLAVSASHPVIANNSVMGFGSNTGAVTVKAFEDMDETSPYYEDVYYVAEKGIMDGKDTDEFSPAAACSRETIALALYRMAYSPATNGNNIFKDIEDDRSCREAVIWGTENGIIKGIEDYIFAPDSNITREQLVTFLFRYACFRGAASDVSDLKALTSYTDSSDISEWAVNGFMWALDSGIITGEEDNRINPKAEVSRMQTAAVLSRYMKSTRLSYTEFKALAPDERKKAFSGMSGDEIYTLVKESDENWPVTSYDLISPDNAKDTIILFGDDENLHFNLAWPCFGGFMPETIDSIGNLSGTLEVSRDGGDGGCSVTYGKNEDRSYPNDSQRSVPKTSATVRTGTLDVDKYKKVVDAVTGSNDKSAVLKLLVSWGYTEETASRFISDYDRWFERDEISGPNNISDGAKLAGNEVEEKYGYFGLTAPWAVGNLNLEGGAGQLNTVFSWGTLCASGLIYDTGTAEIK